MLHIVYCISFVLTCLQSWKVPKVLAVDTFQDWRRMLYLLPDFMTVKIHFPRPFFFFFWNYCKDAISMPQRPVYLRSSHPYLSRSTACISHRPTSIFLWDNQGRWLMGGFCCRLAGLINARARDLRGIIPEGHPPLPSLIIWQHPWPAQMIFGVLKQGISRQSSKFWRHS